MLERLGMEGRADWIPGNFEQVGGRRHAEEQCSSRAAYVVSSTDKLARRLSGGCDAIHW